MNPQDITTRTIRPGESPEITKNAIFGNLRASLMLLEADGPAISIQTLDSLQLFLGRAIAKVSVLKIRAQEASHG